ncbi:MULTISPECIES: FecR family protein [unclassified Novosphingobium]|uniref:FecR family protein n=1 Tax=unclassified Novosphingobium TaxID=2644732 RepID=UPI001494A74D|nr:MULTISPECIES: FecR domain-containing protein [unclassified Novosphingobium]MBB3357029.1 transmembrane sensor [Novosphingobium sp. BK256]MBB3373430.1 transmembrane sensor [Novosphingobium sp. BK280]MBB3377799.1 transmembrane sensor [Novosphingobium sp. BK258]MBB3418790.1 transmembrane sensor [Novosphingobium sp. BK267]MBB3450375.1 transmembrane sensor [Novosphingobium sp. BK352]
MADKEQPEGMPRMDQLTREGALWFARMRGPDAESYRPEFEHWLSLGASHRDAYDRAGEIFALGRFLAAQREKMEGEANDNEPVARKWRWAGLAASVLLVVGAGSWFANMEMRSPANRPVQVARLDGTATTERQVFDTVVGGRRNIHLADGSVVDLDEGSELATDFTNSTRELRLKRGRARFEVAHEGRPFVVLAGGGSVTARGTVFDVILGRDRRVTVRLLRGAVDVERPQGPKGGRDVAAVARLEPGEVLSFAAITSLAPSSTAWKGGIEPATLTPQQPLIREYERTPLSAVVAEANMDSATTIRLGDPGIGALRVSGRFRVNNADQVADRLAVLFDLDVERTKSDEITLHKK